MLGRYTNGPTPARRVTYYPKAKGRNQALFLLFSILVLPLLLLGFFLYETYLLDKYVNKEKFPELYDRGIHRKQKSK